MNYGGLRPQSCVCVAKQEEKTGRGRFILLMYQVCEVKVINQLRLKEQIYIAHNKRVMETQSTFFG